MQFFILKIIFDVFPLENLLFVTNVKNHHFVTYISLNFEGEGENGRTSDEKMQSGHGDYVVESKKKMIGKKFLNQV